MSLWVTYPAKEENISTGGENWWNSSQFQIGNGPFVLKSLEPFVRGYFVPNANYWGDKAKLDLEYSYITDTAVAFEAYKNDEFDIVDAAGEDVEVIKADPVLSKEYLAYPGSCTFAVMFHQLKEPFTDQKVREAFAAALDREGFVQDVLNGSGAPTLTWIPPGSPVTTPPRRAGDSMLRPPRRRWPSPPTAAWTSCRPSPRPSAIPRATASAGSG